MYHCHSFPECYNLFSGVKLSIRSFCFITIILRQRILFFWQLVFGHIPEITLLQNQYNCHCGIKKPFQVVNFYYFISRTFVCALANRHWINSYIPLLSSKRFFNLPFWLKIAFDKINTFPTTNHRILDWNPAIWLASSHGLKLRRPHYREPCSKNDRKWPKPWSTEFWTLRNVLKHSRKY